MTIEEIIELAAKRGPWGYASDYPRLIRNNREECPIEAAAFEAGLEAWGGYTGAEALGLPSDFRDEIMLAADGSENRCNIHVRALLIDGLIRA